MTKRSQKIWNYYEGIVESAELVLEMHKQDTVTTFGIRQTEKPRTALAAPVVGKENTNQDHAQQHKGSVDKPKVKAASHHA